MAVTAVTVAVTPVPENVTVAPLENPVPAIKMFVVVLLFGSEFGVIEVTVGPVLTVKTPVPVAVPPSPFVTVTLRAPVVAPLVIEMFTLRCVESVKVVEVTVMPVPENELARLPPLMKPVPMTVMVPVNP